MSGYEFEVSNDFESEGGFLRDKGWYHVIVENVAEGVGPKGNAFEGITLACSVMEGEQKKKSFNHIVGFPKETDKDGGAFRRSIVSRLLLVTNVVNPAARGQKVSIDFQNMMGQQFIVEMVEEKDQHDRPVLRVGNGGTAIFHVDDPRVSKVPKNAEALSMIPAQFRHDAKWFEALKPTPKKPAQQTPEQKAAQSKVDINDM